MKSMMRFSLLVLAFIAVSVVSSGTAGADPPKSPAVSTFAPASDLADQVKGYMKNLQAAVKSKDEYEFSKKKIAKISNTLIVMALALGLSDKDNAYKASAAGMVKAAQQLAAAKDYNAAKAGVDAMKAAIADKAGSADKLKWEKAASLHELMEAVPTLNTKLKGALKKEKRFKKKAKKAAGYAAVIAVIAQGSMSNAADTDAPGETEKWYKFCAEMRDASAEVNVACAKKDYTAAKKALKKLGESCHTCHDVFHEEEH